MLKLIVNADDFGIDEQVNTAVFRCFTNGIVRSASIIANGESFDSAVKIINSNPELDIGIHLALTSVKPVLSSEKVSSLINEDGNFYYHANNFARKYYFEKISLHEVKQELTAQIEKLLDSNITISHIDSHQHIHILPKIFDITTLLAKRFKIKFVRKPKEELKPYMLNYPGLIRRIPQIAILNYFCSKFNWKFFPSADYYTGFYFGGNLTKKNLITLFSNLPDNGICELMCHPGFVNNFENRRESTYQKVDESLALCDIDIQDEIVKKNILLTSFSSCDL